MRFAARLLLLVLLAILLASYREAPTSASGSEAPSKRAKVAEGFVSVPGGKVWYQIVGDGPGTPLLVLHGGPGYPSDYLQPLKELGDERRVVFYDQLGCGKSDRPEDASLWRIERFVKELVEVRKSLDLERVHLYGHSWGTMLGVDYLLTKPDGIQSVVLASPCISSRRWIEDQSRLRKLLPRDVQELLTRHEQAGTVDSEEYRAAELEVYKRNLCRIDPFPEPVQKSDLGMNMVVYQTMWGPAEFLCKGNLKDYDRTSELSEISAPTLFTCGRYDEATPESTRFFQSKIPRSELVIFDDSSHMPHLEEPEKYLATLRHFLRRMDQRGDVR